MSQSTLRSRARATRRQLHAALTLLGAGGIVLSFVSFAYGYVPIRDVFPGGFLEPTWWSVLPCMLLPLPIAIGYAVWLKRSVLPSWYATSAYVLALLSIGPFLAGLIFDFALSDIEFIAYPALFLATFLVAGALVIWGIGRDPHGSLIAMQAVYIVQMQFWLVLAAGEFEAGAWLGALTCLAYWGQIALVAVRRSWLLLLVAPAAVLTIVMLVDA